MPQSLVEAVTKERTNMNEEASVGIPRVVRRISQGLQQHSTTKAPSVSRLRPASSGEGLQQSDLAGHQLPRSHTTAGRIMMSSKKKINRTKQPMEMNNAFGLQNGVTDGEENRFGGIHPNEVNDEWESGTLTPTVRRLSMGSVEANQALDIFEDDGWDTDLEADECTEEFDRSPTALYLESCKEDGLTPASYFLRHMAEPVLEMRHHGLGPRGAKAICAILTNNTEVLKVDLSDNWLCGEGGQRVCEMLTDNCFIADINLSDNHLETSFAKKLPTVFSSNKTLTHLTLSGNDLDDNSAEFLAEAILNATKLVYLNLSKNKLSEKAGLLLMPALSENVSIKHLDLSWNVICRKGAVAIGKAMKANLSIKVLNLAWNGFRVEGARALGDALKTNSCLTQLDLSNNHITAEGAVLLGKGLAVNDSLEVLKIGYNPMMSAGCYAICTSLSRNPNTVMKELDFSMIMVNGDFVELFSKLKTEQLPSLNLIQGDDCQPRRAKIRPHPMARLKSFMEKNNIRLVDFFNKIDTDQSLSVTREEFVKGLERLRKETGIKLTDDEIRQLLHELDKDEDGEINFSELLIGHQDFMDKEKQMLSRSNSSHKTTTK